MRILTYREAINEAIREEMRKDDKIVVFGEDIAEHGGAFQVTKGLFEEFGCDRVKNTPISEVAIIGAAIGSSVIGLRPIAEIMFDDFLLVAGDQVVNQMAKLRYMTGGQLELPITIRMAMGAGLSQAAQHAQCLVGMFMNVPGIKIVCPSDAYDAKGALKAAIRDNNPVLFFEHLKLYDEKKEIPDDDYIVPLGKASIKRKGTDVTVVAISQMVSKAMRVAEKLEKQKNISIEVVDPVTLNPLDIDTIIDSLKKTSRIVIVYNGPKTNGIGAEICAKIAEVGFEYLDSPPVRIAEKDCPIPFSPVLERAAVPQEEDIESAILEVLRK